MIQVLKYFIYLLLLNYFLFDTNVKHHKSMTVWTYSWSSVPASLEQCACLQPITIQCRTVSSLLFSFLSCRVATNLNLIFSNFN